MDRSCGTCVHFRPYRPLSQLLALELGLDHPDLVNELIKIMQDERQKRDEEASFKVRLLGEYQEQWPYRPQMSDHCALRESETVYLVLEMKNRGQRCPDHERAQDEGETCDGCAHRRPAIGPARDQALIARLAQLANNAAVLPREGAAGPSVDEVRKLVGTRKSFEAAQAYYAGRIALRQPEYLAVCGHFSTASDFVPCAVQNPHGRCPARTVEVAVPTRAEEAGQAAAAPGETGDAAAEGGEELGGLPRPGWR